LIYYLLKPMPNRTQLSSQTPPTPNRSTFGFWNLGFVWNLDFGIWSFPGAWILVLGVLVFVTQVRTHAAPAFPGALGFAANATGGRNGSVYHVTTLSDSGPGSFRDAVSANNRIVVFDVGGYINLTSTLLVQDNLTIAGQTAPGDGIGVMGREVSFNSANNVICRHFRFRQGDFDPDSGKSGINLLNATNIILDHVSIEFAQWNNIDAVGCNQITFQNSINANPIGQQFCAHTEQIGSTFAWCYNLFANGHNRQPLAKIHTIYINNVVYNYQAAYTVANTSGFFSHDIINNYFITGPATTSAGNDFYQMNANQSIYSSGNLRDGDNDGTLDGNPTTPGGGGTVLASPWSTLTTAVPTFTSAAAYRYDLSSAGAWPRDQVDDLVVSQIKTLGNGPTGTSAGTAGPGGGLYTNQVQTGLGNSGYGVLNGGPAPLDSDQDGLPDFWETATGSNPIAFDSMSLAPDGYTLLEHYLNWLAEPHVITTNNYVDVDLWQYTSGFTNAIPTYSVDNATNGTIALLGDGHTARFTAISNFVGLAAFRFILTASDSTSYTNTIGILISVPEASRDVLIWRGDGTGNVWAASGPANFFDGTNLVSFTSGDNVTFDDSGSNSPAINLSGTLSPTRLVVDATQPYTFSGSGSLIGSGTLTKLGPGTLTINTVNTLSGGTTITAGSIQLGDGISANGNLSGNITNNTSLTFANPTALIVSANISGPGSLTKNAPGTLTLSGAETYSDLTTINAGTLEFSGICPQGNIINNSALTFKPSTLQTYAGTITGSGSVTMNASGQTLILTSPNSYTGITIITAGNLNLANNNALGSGMVVYTGGAVIVANGVVITNDFSIPSATIDLCMACTNGTATWAGNIVNLGSGAQWRPGSDGGALVFTGTANQGTRNFIVPRGIVHFASNALVSASGPATALGRDSGGNNRSANITIRDNAVLNLGVCSLGGGQAGGSITVNIQNNASLSTGANNLDLHNVNRSTATTTLNLNGGTLIVGSFSKTRIGSTQLSTNNFNGGILRAGANNPSFFPQLNGLTANVKTGGAKIDDAGYSITISQPLLHDPALGATPDGGLLKFGTGTLTLAGLNAYTGPTIVSNGTLLIPGAISGNSGPSPITVLSGATLSGNGTVGGAVTINNGGALSPGLTAIPGTLTINSNLTLNNSSLLNFGLGSTSDKVIVSGNLALAGILNITNLAGFAANTYTLFTYSGTLTGNLPAIGVVPSGFIATINTNTPGQVNLILQLPSPPTISNVSLSTDGTLILNAIGGPANSACYILTSTNISAPLVQWTRLATNQFDASGNLSFTNSIDPNTSQAFYLLQLP
jgi:autotransporter-associated beta strand protein